MGGNLSSKSLSSDVTIHGTAKWFPPIHLAHVRRSLPNLCFFSFSTSEASSSPRRFYRVPSLECLSCISNPKCTSHVPSSRNTCQCGVGWYGGGRWGWGQGGMRVGVRGSGLGWGWGGVGLQWKRSLGTLFIQTNTYNCCPIIPHISQAGIYFIWHQSASQSLVSKVPKNMVICCIQWELFLAAQW